ncbi:MAG: 1,4-dihydroxy-2-naphthoate octaprenyltransferase [Chlamydiia bacterium]|nr:1,4-dihydroxy-2-naphthoate octaprenyltransferase [Chlamydiia bacterium]
MKNGNQILPASPSALKLYVSAMRPRTWPLSLAPVCIGTSMVRRDVDLALFLCALLFSLFIQIGTNLANDYFDFVKGADNAHRIGPLRACASGLIEPRSIYRTALAFFASALFVAIPLMVRVGLWSLPIAASCVLFGIFYTGGKKPLGYLGLGEILALIFFGPVACCGAYYLQTGLIRFSVFLSALSPGLLSVAVLVANNLRDEKSDRLAGKWTLIARLGRTFGSWEYALCILLAGIIPYFIARSSFQLLPMAILPASYPLIRKAFCFDHPKELIGLLKGTVLLLVAYTVLFSIAWM